MVCKRNLAHNDSKWKLSLQTPLCTSRIGTLLQRGHLHQQHVAAVPITVHIAHPQNVLMDLGPLHSDKSSICQQLLHLTHVTALTLQVVF